VRADDCSVDFDAIGGLRALLVWPRPALRARMRGMIAMVLGAWFGLHVASVWLG
jgi:hypothetical protein